MSDYVLEVSCDHPHMVNPRPEPKVVYRITYVPPDPLPEGVTRFGYQAWRELDDPDHPQVQQSWFLFGRPGEMSPAGRHRMWCSVCDETVEARHEKLLPILERLRECGVSSILLAHLAPMLGR